MTWGYVVALEDEKREIMRLKMREAWLFGALMCAVVFVGGCGDDGGGGGEVSVTPPQISTHPSDQTVSEGQTATFSATATGSATLSYQWQKDGVDVVDGTGETAASYTTPRD